MIETSGEHRCFERSSESGRPVRIYFCPNCGSSVFWRVEFLQGSIGIAVGCFADPDFPPPRSIAWTDTKHGWLEFPAGCRFSSTQKF